MAEKYGPIFTIWLGVHRTIVVSNWEIAKECFTTNDKAFANRPKGLALEVLGYNYAMIGFSPYSPIWRQVRKMATLEATTKVENDRNDQCRKALREIIDLSGEFVVSDALPYLRWFDIGGSEKAMKKTAKELDDVTEKWLKEHKQRKISGGVNDYQDFMDVIISTVTDDDETSGYGVDTIIKVTCLVLISAASDTSTITLTSALSLLLSNPETLTKVQEELDIHICRERQVKELDMKNLVCLQAILKETMRLYPAAPLLLPHESMEDCTLVGYHILAGTRLIVNLPKLHRDPNVWVDPSEFQPERFLTTHKDVDVRGQNFELIPFGSRRRMCPGISFALQVMQLTLATLLHAFEIQMNLWT
uniref:Cytochrome P450 n=1 Tax=Quercus lobata TaxID=97700 RepID=A0A7N2MP82_QUELO